MLATAIAKVLDDVGGRDGPRRAGVEVGPLEFSRLKKIYIYLSEF